MFDTIEIPEEFKDGRYLNDEENSADLDSAEIERLNKIENYEDSSLDTETRNKLEKHRQQNEAQ